MPTPERKPPGGGDFYDPDNVPENLLATLHESQRRLSRSTAWPIVALDHASVAEGLKQHESIVVEVRCGAADFGQSQVSRRAKLARQMAADGRVEFHLILDTPLPTEREPFAIGVGPLDVWKFAQARLGEMPTLQLPPSAAHGAAEPSFALSAAGKRDIEAQEVKTDRVCLRWRDYQLQIIAAQPPQYRGQPVVVDVNYIDDDGEHRSFRRAVSLEHAIDAGEFAGQVWGGFDCHVPGRAKQFQIQARPIAPDELDLLEAPLLERFLGTQGATMLLAEGNAIVSAAAEWEDQQLAVLDPSAAWFLLSARKGVH